MDIPTLESPSPAVEETPTPPKRRRRWLRVLGYVGAGILVVFTFLLADVWRAMGTQASGERLERMRASPNFDAEAEVFVNRLKPHDPDLMEALSRWIDGGPNRVPESPPPVVRLSRADFDVAPKSGLRATWLGHSSILIEIDGARFLTDPVWSDRASPSSLIGPERFFEPPLAFADLPEIDAVVISHDHYDHLDMQTVDALNDRGATFVVPLGVGAHLEYWDVPADRIIELDWWESTEINGVTLHSTPARHFSGRSLTDRNATLWSSWSFVGRQHRAFFSGDTGMFPGFTEIGERLGPFDLTMMESGAYNELWADIHLGPEQAVAAHQALRGRLMMPVHWGTFNLALHTWTEPAERVIAAALESRVHVVVPRPGESVEPALFDENDPVARWWPELPWDTANEAPIVASGLATVVP